MGNRSNSKYTFEQKAQAVAMMKTTPMGKVSKELEIPRGTLSNWKRAYEARSHTKEGIENVQAIQIQQLVIETLAESLITQKAISKHARNVDWLEKQSANEVAILYGVMADKSRLIIDAMIAYNETILAENDYESDVLDVS